MIKARMSIQIMGNLANAITKALKKTIEFINERPDIKVTKENYAKPQKMKKLPLLTAFVEFEAEYDSFETFLGAVMDFGPEIVEVIEPEKLEINIEQMQNISSDMAEKFKQDTHKIQQLEALLAAQLRKDKKTK